MSDSGLQAAVRLTLVSSSLACGGAERVAQLLAGGLARDGHAITLITTTSRADFFAQPDEVTRVRLDLVGDSPGSGLLAHMHPRGVMRGLGALGTLGRTIVASSPDAVISFMDQVNVVVLMSLRGRRIPVIVTEHSDPAHRPLTAPWKVLRRWVYPRAARIVSVSRGVDRYFEWLPRAKREVIHNPVSTRCVASSRSDLPEPVRHGRFIAAMGRLTRAKGFDLMIRSFGRLSADLADWQLVILGSGEEERPLRRLASDLNLTQRVHFLGAVKDPASVLQHAEIFASSSRWEGFGNAIVEAMACGVPVISFDCPSGPSEIIVDGVNGILVPPGDLSGFTTALIALAQHPERREAMGREGKNRAGDFAVTNIVRSWNELLAQVARSPAGNASPSV